MTHAPSSLKSTPNPRPIPILSRTTGQLLQESQESGKDTHSISVGRALERMLTVASREIPIETLASTVTLRVKHKFRQRYVEWLAACQITAFGFILIQDGDSLQSPGMVLLNSMATESQWAILLFVIGIARIVGLLVNGSMEYVTPWIRTVGAFAGLYVFGIVNTSLLYSVIALGNPASLGLAMCGCAFFGEIAAIVHAIMDARTYENGRRERRSTRESGA